MPISLDSDSKILKVKILPSPHFNRERDSLLRKPGRKAIYDGETFQYWEFPLSSLSNIIDNWGEAIVVHPDAQPFFDSFLLKSKPIDELEPSALTVESLDLS